MLPGRESKIESLEKNYLSDGKYAVIYGGHRSGKTSLLSHFMKDKKGIFFSAQKLNSYMNLRLFEKAVSEYSGEEESFPRWKEAFQRIGYFAREEKFVLAIDDFSDLVFVDDTILTDFQDAFEKFWKDTKLFVVTACGRPFFTESVILESHGLGRRPTVFKLDELDYLDSAKLLPKNLSSQDKLRYYCTLGGVPEFLKLVKEGVTFEENIKNIFLTEKSPLYNSLEKYYMDELREPQFYNSILSSIAGGSKRINEIVADTGESSTKVNKYLLTLLQMQIVSRDIPFGDDPTQSRKGIYRISSQALAFWFKFVLPVKSKIAMGETPYNDIEKMVDEYIEEKIFFTVVMQYLTRKNKQGMLPILGSTISGYWSSLKEYGDYRMIVANPRNRQIIFVKAQPRFSDPADKIMAGLKETEELFPEYWDRSDMLFSIAPFSRELSNMQSMKLKLVDIDELYK